VVVNAADRSSFMRRVWRQNAQASTPGARRCGLWMTRSTSIRLRQMISVSRLRA